jgi:hypothetical protein
MKRIGITSTAILSLFLGIAAPAYAQRDQQGDKQDQGKHEQGKPEGKQDKQQQAKPERQRQDQNKQPQHAQQQQQSDRNRQQPQRAQQQQSDRNQQQPQRAERQQQSDRSRQQSGRAQQQQGRQQPQPQRSQAQQREQHSAWQQHRSQRWDSDHRTWQQRGGYSGYRIPDDRFRGYFGPEHGFRIYGRPFLVVGGYPRFQYNGYWVSLVDPWPEYWADNWYDTDDVYVTYVDNGYYLFNRRHPSVGLAISISL